ncbi:MAG: hypothetical protein FWE32_05985 [Oscillospiraceae bacterium]|nr:hypothetical protein [Oscillospiraceae bacterium]
MSIDTFKRQEAMLDLREKILEAEQMRETGTKSYTPEEVFSHLEAIVNEYK